MIYNIKMYDMDNKPHIVSLYDGIHYDNDKGRFIVKGIEMQKNVMQCGFNITDARGNEVFLGDVVSCKGVKYIVNYNYYLNRFVLEGLENNKKIKDIKKSEFYYIQNAVNAGTLDRINGRHRIPTYKYKNIFKFTIFSYRYRNEKSYVSMNGLIKFKELLDFDELSQISLLKDFKTKKE